MEVLGDVHLGEAEGVEESGDGGAGVFAGGVEDTIGEGCFLELVLGLGAGVGFEVGVCGDEEAGGADVDTGVLVVEGGDEELRRGKVDVDGAACAGFGDANVFGLELGEVDAGDGLAVDDEEEAVSGEEVGEDLAGVGAFDHGVEGVDDGFEAAEALDLFDDGGDGGVEGDGAVSDEGGDAAEGAGGGVVDEYAEGDRSEDEGEEEDEAAAGGRTAIVVLGGHGRMLVSLVSYEDTGLW